MNYSKEIRTYDAEGAVDLLCPRRGADNLDHVVTVFYMRGEDGADASVGLNFLRQKVAKLAPLR